MKTLCVAVFLVAASWLAPPAPAPKSPTRDVSFVATRQPVGGAMLDLAGVTANDVVYGLGSGDGRVVITAAKRFGARGVGIEMDPALVKQAIQNAAAAGVARRVRFVAQNLF